MLTDDFLHPPSSQVEQRTAEGVGEGEEGQKQRRGGGKRPRSSGVLILLVSPSCPEAIQDAVS